MKGIPYTLVQHKTLNGLIEDSKSKESIILSATTFVKEIEKGNLNVLYDGGEQTDEIDKSGLSASLISMRDQMKKIAQVEKERKWVTEGMAQFVEILRATNNVLELSDNIIRSLVKYLNANQGILFILNDENQQDVHLQVTGCYAYDRKRYIDQKIDIGAGLAGQSVLEKDTIYITDIPQTYIKITSGLGEARPSNVLIVPLKVNDNVYGVVEIASFAKFADYQIEFVEKLSESIASSLSSVKGNEQTQKLLKETQLQAEQMRAQEEEMRQNMEELSATQEEMQRSQKRTEATLREIEEKEVYMNNLLNATSDSVIAVDTNRNITLFNKFFYDTMASYGVILKKGMDILGTLRPSEHESEIARFERIFNGESHVDTKEYYGRFYRVNSQPLRNSNNEVIGACTFTSEITELMIAQKSAEQTKKELQIREEVIGLTTIFSESDPFGTIQYVNSKLCEVSRYSSEELTGKPHNVFRHPDMPKELFKLLWETIKSGNVFRGIIKNKAKNGSHYWVDATIVPVKNEEGEIYKYISSRYHITDDDMAEALYNRQARKLGLPEMASEQLAN